MGETRNRNSVQVNEEGKNKLQEAKAGKRNYNGNLWTDLDTATEAGVSEKTVERFFSGKTVSKKSAIAIARALDLELTDLIDAKATTPPPEIAATPINWREVCSTRLEPHRRISSNFLMQDECAKKDKEQIYVPLALVQRTKTDKRDKGNFLPDVGTRLYEPQYETQQRFEHEAFLSQILESEALVQFEDGCNSQSQISNWKGFYEYQAYFLAAAGIAEFKDCALADAIVKQIVTWGIGYFNIEKQQWQTFDERIEEKANAVLAKTDRKKASAALEELIRDSQDESTRWLAAYSLGEIAEDNPTAIAALVELIRDSQDEFIRLLAASSLGQIAPDNPTAIAALKELIRDSQDEDTRRQAAYSLGRIAPDNPTAIAALEELIRDSQDEDTRRQAAYSLGRIAPDNPTAIAALKELIRDSQDGFTRWLAASILGQITPDNPTRITALVELIRDFQDEFTRWLAVYSLGQIAPDNPTAIAALVELIRDSQFELTRRQAASSLMKILTESDKMTAVVTALKNDLSDEAYKVIWHCTQTMTYPAFYQAWHSDSFPLQN